MDSGTMKNPYVWLVAGFMALFLWILAEPKKRKS